MDFFDVLTSLIIRDFAVPMSIALTEKYNL